MGIAFFDIDHTIIPKTSAEAIFLKYLAKKNEIKFLNYLQFILFFLHHFLFDFNKALRQNKYYIKNKNIKDIDKLAADCFEQKIKNSISKQAIIKIKKHQNNNDQIILLSALPCFLGKYIKNYLQANELICTETKIKNNKYTGQITGTQAYGLNKQNLIKKYLTHKNTYGYANSYADRYFLDVVKNPFTVNASKKLKKYGQQNNWPQLNWL